MKLLTRDEQHVVLKECGFTHNQSLIYIALINAGPSSAGNLAKKSGLNRVSVYDVLEKLEMSGFISSFEKDGKKHFSAGSPEKIVHVLDREKNELDERKKAFLGMLPSLMIPYNMHETEVSVVHGDSGVKDALNALLDANSDIFSIGSIRGTDTKMKYFLKTWHRRRAGMKVFRSAVVSALTERFPMEDIFNGNVGEMPFVNIAGERVSITFFNTEPVTVMIKDAAFARGMKVLFNALSSGKDRI